MVHDVSCTEFPGRRTGVIPWFSWGQHIAMTAVLDQENTKVTLLGFGIYQARANL